MKLYFSDSELVLKPTKVMGILDIQPNLCKSETDYVNQALAMQDAGAELLEVGLLQSSSVEDELRYLLPVVEALYQKTYMVIAVHTSYPEIMDKSVTLGAQMIVDSNALRAPGALEMAQKLDVPVCLVFDYDRGFESDDDPVATVSEFLYERVDACLNAGISKKRILIDPTLGLCSSIESRLKLLGRISTFQSFGLPICIAVPRSLPEKDCFMHENLAVSITIAIFGVQHGVHIIRTKLVRDMVLALDTLDSAENSSQPFRLSKAIASKLLRRKSINNDIV